VSISLVLEFVHRYYQSVRRDVEQTDLQTQQVASSRQQVASSRPQSAPAGPADGRRIRVGIIIDSYSCIAEQAAERLGQQMAAEIDHWARLVQPFIFVFFIIAVVTSLSSDGLCCPVSFCLRCLTLAASLARALLWLLVPSRARFSRPKHSSPILSSRTGY